MPTLSPTKIDTVGHWLRADAAASYLRMVAAGMPLGGLVSAGRTRAEQERLYDLYLHHGGNLAAKPGTSRHETGLAIDVTRKSAQQLWMVHGSNPMKVTRAGTTRAAAYGWTRSVPSEAWHFSYNPAGDKHRNDKPAPPVVVTPPPVVVTPPPVVPKPSILPTLARLATLNCHGWNLPEKSWTKAMRTSLLAEVVRLGCSVYALNECPEYMRDAIRASLPGGAERWRVVPRGDDFHQAVLLDSKKWKWTGYRDPIKFGPTDYHGGVWATLTQRTTKAQLAVGSYHLPPNVVATGEAQVRYLQAFLKAAPKVSARIAGGDGADYSSWAEGWQDARIIAATSSNRAAGTYGTKVKDRIFMLGAVVRRYTVGPVIAATDHRSVLAQITIPGTITTN